MSDRYFVELPITGSAVTLEGPEAHHLIHVMRAKAGHQVVLFDGSGFEFAAVVDRIGRSSVALQVVSKLEISRELPVQLVLAVALPKGDRQKWLVEKAVELGVAAIVPLNTARSVAAPAESALGRLQRGVIEASKQCGRNRLMEIRQPVAWADLVTSVPKDVLRLLAHPAISTAANNTADFGQLNCIYAAVGPEGGFTEDEIRLAIDQGWQGIDLGPIILRIETAAICIAARVAASARPQQLTNVARLVTY